MDVDVLAISKDTSVVIRFSATELSSGGYYHYLQTGAFIDTKKLEIINIESVKV